MYCFFKSKSPSRHLKVLATLQLLLLCCAVLFSTVSNATPRVVVTIKPLEHILAALTEGLAELDLVLDSNQDPHHIVLRPSERKLLAEADLLIWIGPALELPLQKIIEQRVVTDNSSVITAQDIDGLTLQHVQDQIDPHLWLDIDNVRLIAQQASTALIRLDPDHQSGYLANLQTFQQVLSMLQQEVEATLATTRDQPWAVEHNAFRYFQQQFALTVPFTLKDSDNNEPGLRTVLAFNAQMKTSELHCILAEADSNPAELRSILDNSALMVQTTDILGYKTPVTPRSYAQLLLAVAGDIKSCAGAKHDK